MATQAPQKSAAEQIAGDIDTENDDVIVAEPVAKRKRAKEIVAAAPTERFMVCKVTRRGADKLSTGVHFPTEGDEFFAQGETIVLPESVAKEQESGLDRLGEEKNYIDIVREASPDEVKAFHATTLVKPAV